MAHWKTPNSSIVSSRPGHQGMVYQLTFSADSKLLISSTDDTAPLVWDLTGKEDGKPEKP